MLVELDGPPTVELAPGQDPKKRRQILEGARKVFHDKGFHGASMNDIARATSLYGEARRLSPGASECGRCRNRGVSSCRPAIHGFVAVGRCAPAVVQCREDAERSRDRAAGFGRRELLPQGI